MRSPGFRHQSGSRLACRETETAYSSQWRVICLYLLLTSSFQLIHVFLCSVSPSDVPGGFCVKQLEEAREGGDLHLTCLANKYLYTALSWQRVNNTEEAQSRGLNNQQFTFGEFSNSLVLLISNLTARDSGAYRCSARHIVTGQETHLDTQVEVTSE